MTFKAVLVAIALLTPTFSFADDAMSGMAMAKSPADQAYMQAMKTMMDATDAMKPTGDANKDFVMMMKPHHQAAVEMAEAYLRFGSDPTLKKMAEDIVASQKKEIDAMNAWEKQHDM